MQNLIYGPFLFRFLVVGLFICMSIGGQLESYAALAYEMEKPADIDRVIYFGASWFGGDNMLGIGLLQKMQGKAGDGKPDEGWMVARIFLRGERSLHDEKSKVIDWKVEDYFKVNVKGKEASELSRHLGIILSKETPQDISPQINPEQGSLSMLFQKQDGSYELGHFLKHAPYASHTSNQKDYSYTFIEDAYRQFATILNMAGRDIGSVSDSPLVALHLLNRIMLVAAKDTVIFDRYFFKFRKEVLMQTLSDAVKTDEKGRVAICHRKGRDEARTLWVDLPDAFNHLDHGDDPGSCKDRGGESVKRKPDKQPRRGTEPHKKR